VYNSSVLIQLRILRVENDDLACYDNTNKWIPKSSERMIRMLGQNNQISEIEDIMVRNDLFNKFSLTKLGVFGSTARGEVSNDIDILIEDNIDYQSLSVLRDELQRLTNKRIDIVIARYANPIVLHRARKEIIYVSR